MSRLGFREEDQLPLESFQRIRSGDRPLYYFFFVFPSISLSFESIILVRGDDTDSNGVIMDGLESCLCGFFYD